MKNKNQPVRTTIVFGLIAGLLFIFSGILFEQTLFWPFFFRTAIFVILLLYSFLLASWSDKKRISVIFPLLFLFFFTFSQSPDSAILLLGLGMLSWIRSGICFENGFSKSLGAEIIFSIGGGALVACFSPHSPLTWGLGIWMFFLVQSLYFILTAGPEIVGGQVDLPEDSDTFDQARVRAEDILRS